MNHVCIVCFKKSDQSHTEHSIHYILIAKVYLYCNSPFYKARGNELHFHKLHAPVCDMGNHNSCLGQCTTVCCIEVCCIQHPCALHFSVILQTQSIIHFKFSAVGAQVSKLLPSSFNSAENPIAYNFSPFHY